MPQVANLSGAPTKRFFVSMLPRDIELDDAILDLVDNSVDGAMRQRRHNLSEARPFEGYSCNLVLNPEYFELSDNCGGIPNTHIEGAFRLGRPSLELDGTLPTIGMYGIGMKRAIFKMAQDATITSRSNDRAVKVRYDPTWLDPESEDWNLRIEEIDATDERGVTIRIPQLQAGSAKRFGSDSFLDALRDKLGQHFAYIIGRGFSITLNGDSIDPETVQMILSDAIQPFDYEALVEGVKIKVTVGFYRNLTRQAELEDATDPEGNDPTGRATDEAGITVICNDRVIVMSDRTTITGWGLGITPRYHPQFRAITGLITFSSDDAKLLPISTTKRDLDTDSDTYRPARNAAMEGIALFVGFTNRWKGSEELVDEMLSVTNRVEARSISLASESGARVRNTTYNEFKFRPALPVPEKGTRKRRIAFSRDHEEVKEMGNALLDDESAKAGDIGGKAWDTVLQQVRRK
ncbi:ATP-binding protein [Devosia sp. J2-20]|uniref:ATP-binding protein n=1 Tax=Devosia sp. J2-20 TaxID=3026161 RepID=UPI00249B2693|nr:ATP-binding protein [Devosia sp. J2-20]WDQ98162.1 ATP-binding protein [Devosia sp. J2-20]